MLINSKRFTSNYSDGLIKNPQLGLNRSRPQVKLNSVALFYFEAILEFLLRRSQQHQQQQQQKTLSQILDFFFKGLENFQVKEAFPIN